MITNLKIERLSPDDIGHFEGLIKLFEDVFEMKNFFMPDGEHLRALLARKDFHAFVAWKSNSIIGGLTAYTLQQYYSVKPLAYIFDLAVSAQFQKNGVGKELIEQSKAYFKALDYEEMFVQADKVDQYAIDFYRKTNPTEEQDVSHFYYLLNNSSSGL